MYAIIQNGGQQYRVSAGDVLRVAKVEKEVGEQVDLDKVLLVADGSDVTLGVPFVDGAVVNAEILSHGRAKKITIIKFRRRKHHMKKQGHRQDYTEIKVVGIQGKK